jgi:hypothetical protein
MTFCQKYIKGRIKYTHSISSQKSFSEMVFKMIQTEPEKKCVDKTLCKLSAMPIPTYAG